MKPTSKCDTLQTLHHDLDSPLRLLPFATTTITLEYSLIKHNLYTNTITLEYSLIKQIKLITQPLIIMLLFIYYFSNLPSLSYHLWPTLAACMACVAEIHCVLDWSPYPFCACITITQLIACHQSVFYHHGNIQELKNYAHTVKLQRIKYWRSLT